MTGKLIIAAGLLVALWLALSGHAADSSDAVAAATNQRLYEFNLERIGGKAAVYTARFNDFLDSLWHGDRLPYTVGVLSTLAGLLCLALARALEHDEQPPL